MKKILFTILLAITPVILIGQQKLKVEKTQIITYASNINEPLTNIEKSQIDEVYADQAEPYVYSNPGRLNEIKNILRNRVTIEEFSGKDLSSIPRLSSLKLVNEFNSSVTIDNDIANFNPLKYHINFYERANVLHYRFANTQYVVTILPITTKK